MLKTNQHSEIKVEDNVLKSFYAAGITDPLIVSVTKLPCTQSDGDTYNALILKGVTNKKDVAGVEFATKRITDRERQKVVSILEKLGFDFSGFSLIVTCVSTDDFTRIQSKAAQLFDQDFAKSTMPTPSN